MALQHNQIPFDGPGRGVSGGVAEGYIAGVARSKMSAAGMPYGTFLAVGMAMLWVGRRPPPYSLTYPSAVLLRTSKLGFNPFQVGYQKVQVTLVGQGI